MTKAELITRTIERITDPWTESPSLYEDAELIDLDVAKDILAQCREEDLDLDEEDRLPAEVTAEIMMDAYNCNVRMNKFELRAERLAEYITDHEMVCEYSNYYLPTLSNGIDMLPVDFMYNSDCFPFETGHTNNPDIIELLRIGVNSKDTFNPNHEFCWFDKENEVLHSTDRPFGDGILDAEGFARYVLLDADALNYFIDGLMDDDDIRYVFGCTKEELIHED